jgi:DNA repair exonuclease SbcCD nuclease subunit
MAKILFTADVHLGLPKKLNDILWSLKTIKEYAKKNDIDTVVILGDLFHDRVNINIEVLNAACEFFEEAKNEGQKWIAFPGNHDMPLRNSWDINALKPLRKQLTIIDSIKLLKLHGQRFFVVPFIHYEAIYMKIIDQIEQQYQNGDILLTHVGVHNATLNECFLIKNWSTVNFERSLFDLVFTGHFHCHQSVGERKNVWYPGSPIPFRFDEGMVPHGFIEFDTETREVEFVNIFKLDLVEGPKPPDYVTVTDDMVIDDYDFSGDHVRVQLNRDYSKDELLRMRTALTEAGAINVKLNKMKEEKLDLAKTPKSEVSLQDPTNLFEQWLEHDKPKKLDVDLLKKLNIDIIAKSTGKCI